MDEVWERAIDYARGGEDPLLVRSLTLDGSVKGPPGRLPHPALFEQFSQLRILSIANVNLISLTGFPSLPLLERLILSDNRICGGLEVLVEAELISLRDLDLSNNKIQCLSDLNPLAKLNLLSLDLYKCPVTRIPDYRSKVFSLIRSLQYLDKVDTENNEWAESDEEEDDEEDDDELAEDEGGKSGRVVSSAGVEDDDESNEEKDIQDYYDHGNSGESDELSEDDDDSVQYHATENHEVYRKEVSGSEEVDDDDDSDDEDNDDEIEVQEIEEDAGEDDGEEDDDEGKNHVGSSNGDINSQDEDEGGELGDEDEEGDVDDDDDDEDQEEDPGSEYLVQPIAKAEEEEQPSDFWPGEDEDEDEEIDDNDLEDQLPVTSTKRKRSKDDSEDDERPPKQ